MTPEQVRWAMKVVKALVRYGHLPAEGEVQIEFV